MLIVGAGITGLTAAYTLERETDFEILLLEASTRIGGKLETTHRDGFTIELGPDSLFTGKPDALELVRELGMEHEIVEPTASGYHLLVNGILHRVPSGLASLTGIDQDMIEQATFLSEEGKRRALAECDVERGDGNDESIRSFFTRRFGEEFSAYVAEPILAGTHAGDPEKLSMRALYPKYLDQEQRDGNLSMMPKNDRKAAMFVSFKSGMQSLADTLYKSLDRTLTGIGHVVKGIEFESTHAVLHADEHPFRHEVDHVLLTVPSPEAANVLKSVPATGRLLMKIPFASSTVLTAAYPAANVSERLCGTGFLTPFEPQQCLTGCTWTSLKWPDRAPDNVLLVRYYFGGVGRPSVCGNELLEIARQAASQVLGITVEPIFTDEQQWNCSLPQYNVGHTELVDSIEQSLSGKPTSLAGSSYRGVGIPDCIRQGREAARKIAARLA